MKFKILALSILIILSPQCFSQETAEIKTSSGTSNEEVQKEGVLIPDSQPKPKAQALEERNISDTLDSDYLFQFYKERNGTKTQFDYEYLIEEPMTLEEARDLNHPYFEKHITNMPDASIDDIAKKELQNEFKDLRTNAIFDTAVKYGIQSGMYKVLTDHQNKIERIAPYYDNIFNFNRLMMYNGRVKPPVVIESNQEVTKEGNYMLRDIKKAFTFHSQAEVVTRPPSFRDYMLFVPIRPNQPNPLGMPLKGNMKEYITWQNGVQEGWIQGTRQAYLVITEGIYKLARDYYGMQRYLLMLDEKIVSQPVITESDLAISTNGRTINIGESTFTISELPEFNVEGRTWRALPRIDSIFKEEFFLTDKDKEFLKELKIELNNDRQ